MFRPLEAIFRLHKIDLEEKEYNIYSKHNGVSMLRSEHYYVLKRKLYSCNSSIYFNRQATRNNAEISTLIHRCAYYIYCIPALPNLFCVT